MYRLLSEPDAHAEKELRESLNMKAGSAFSMLKRYLYEDLMECVLLPFSRENENSVVRREMDRAAYFRSKGLLELAFRELKTAYVRARKFECFSMMLEIQDNLFKLVVELNEQSYFHWYEEEVLPLQSGTVNALATLHRVNAAWLPMLKEIKVDGRISPDQIEKFRQVGGGALEKDFPDIAEITTLVRYCIGLGASYSVVGNLPEAIRHRRKVQELFSRHPHLIDDRIVEYCGNLYNLIGNLIAEEEYGEAREWLEHLREQMKHPRLRPDLRMQEIQKLRVRLLEIQLALQTGAPGKALELASSTPGKIQNCVTGIGREYLSSIRMHEIYQMIEHEKPGTLVRVRSLRKEMPPDFRHDLNDWLVLTEMVLLYRQEEFDYLAYFCTNRERDLRKRHRKNSVYLKLPKLLRKLMGTAEKDAKIKLISDFLSGEQEKEQLLTLPVRIIMDWLEDLLSG